MKLLVLCIVVTIAVSVNGISEKTKYSATTRLSTARPNESKAYEEMLEAARLARQKASKTGENVMDTASNIGERVRDTASDVLQGAKTKTQDLVEGAQEFVEDLGKKAKSAVQMGTEKASEFLESAKKTGEKTTRQTGENISEYSKDFSDSAKLKAWEAKERAKLESQIDKEIARRRAQLKQSDLNRLDLSSSPDYIQNVRPNESETYERMRDKTRIARQKASKTGENVMDTASDIGERVRDTASDVFQGAKDKTKDVVEGAQEFVEDLGEKAKGAMQMGKEKASEFLESAKKTGKQATRKAGEFIEDVGENIHEFSKDALNSAKLKAWEARERAKLERQIDKEIARRRAQLKQSDLNRMGLVSSAGQIQSVLILLGLSVLLAVMLFA